ncbi:MAG: DNA replication protein psf2 [Trizodia sp. TS-e1964]|nr:MAG: DNA replication protein psf2 [Trizodia sp. TS-e1964]
MAHPLPPGLTPSETAFLCEMEQITIIPRQRLAGLSLLGGPTSTLLPPHRSTLPLWLALLLKRQRRADIVPPPWLHPDALAAILDAEMAREGFSAPPPFPSGSKSGGDWQGTRGHVVSPPFLPSATAEAPAGFLPYHWLEMGHMLLDAAPEDLVEPDAVRRLMRDLREVRGAKIRAGVGVLSGVGVVGLGGVGGLEVGEGRAFIAGVVDGLRKIGAAGELARKEREAEEGDEDEGEAGEEDDMEM